MNIGKLKIQNPVFLAPMAGYTDHPFRMICKKMGAGIVYTEFVSSEGLIRKSQKTEDYLIFDNKERPVGVQIFGHNPDSMADSAQYVEEKFAPDIIDINMGCSVRKVVKKNAGAALLKDIKLLSQIANSVVKAVKTPVTAKIRSGWNHNNIVAVDVARILEDNGIAAITVHPRTASDGFGNVPDLRIIGDVKKTVKIPIIGNGDIFNPKDAENMIKQTDCDAVMVGRGTIGNPWLIKKITSHFHGTNSDFEVTQLDKINMCIEHLKMEIIYRDENKAHKIMKKFYGKYFRGFPDAAKIRQKLVLADSPKEVFELLFKLKSEF